MKELDPGHVYKLNTLDGDQLNLLTFVKREGEKYPGNVGHHSGTTTQEVCRALIARTKYVNNQEAHVANILVITYLQSCIYELESRAAYRHHLEPPNETEVPSIEELETCTICGHIWCIHKEQIV